MLSVQEITTLQALSADIQQLRIALEARNPERYDAQISNSMPWVVDYKGRKHVYMLSPVILTITSTDIGNINIPPGVWYLIDFPEGMRVYTTNQVSPIYIHIQASDEILIPGAIALVQDGSGIGANVNLSQINGVAVNSALAQLGLNAVQIAGVTIPAINGILPISQSSNNATIPAASGTVVVKNAPGDLVTIVITTAGTVAFQVFDNASAASGTLLYQSVTAPAVGTPINIFGRAKAGITVAGGGAGGAAFTVFYN